MSSHPVPAPLVTRPMVATLVLLASTPLWLKGVGLSQYLALEIVIWMIFAMAHNLLLGHGGMPSFGHGAYFGVGAYGFGLLQQRAGAELLGGLAARCSSRRRSARRWRPSSRTGAASTTRC